MAGCSIPTGGSIRYASGSISAGETTSLLSTFTEISNAVPASGNRMYPVWSPANANLYFTIDSGSYAGNYYINRNNTYGVDAWSEAQVNSGRMRLNLLRGYQHWPADNYVNLILSNKTADIHNITINFNATTIFNQDLAASQGSDYNSNGIILCANAPGNSAFDVGTVSTDWTVDYTVENKDAINTSNVTVTVTDHHTSESLHTSNFSLSSGTVWSFNDGYSHRYWQVPKIDILIDIP